MYAIRSYYEDRLGLLADEQEFERRIIHFPDNSVDRIDQVAESLFVGDDRMLANLDRFCHARELSYNFV